MLGIFTIFLITISAAFIVVRFYRAIDGWQGFKQPSVGQQKSSSKKTAKLRNHKDEVKAPWGW